MIGVAVSVASVEARPAIGFFELDLLDNRYPALHGMRVLAIVSVVQYHVTSLFQLDRGLELSPRWADWSTRIFFGMDLFFVLSGFLIGSILLRSAESPRPHQVRRFYLRRAFRTFPSYYLILNLLVIGSPLLFSEPLTAAQRMHLPLEYLYLTDYAYPRIPGDLVMPWGWSLAVEEKFYLVVPLLFFSLRAIRSDKARLALLVSIWVSALCVRLAIYRGRADWTSDSLSDAIYFRWYTRYDTLIAGVTFAFVHRRWRNPLSCWLKEPWMRTIVALFSFACLAILLQPAVFGRRHELLVHVFAWGTLTSAMYAGWLLLLLHGDDSWLRRLLSARVFRRVATLGYGVYLVHLIFVWWPLGPIAHWLRERHGWPMGAVWSVSLLVLLVLSLACSYLLHLFVEKPALRLRDRFAQ